MIPPPATITLLAVQLTAVDGDVVVMIGTGLMVIVSPPLHGLWPDKSLSVTVGLSRSRDGQRPRRHAGVSVVRHAGRQAVDRPDASIATAAGEGLRRYA